MPRFVLGKGLYTHSDGLPGFPVPTCLPVAYSKESLQGRICCWQSASGTVTRDAIAHRHQGEKEGELEILGTLILISSCYLIVNSKMLNNIEIYSIDMDTFFVSGRKMNRGRRKRHGPTRRYAQIHLFSPFCVPASSLRKHV